MERLGLLALLVFSLISSITSSPSAYICKNAQDPAVQEQCRQQQASRLRFMPSNESIHYITNEPMLSKKHQVYFKLSVFDPHRDARFFKDFSVPLKKRHILLLHCFQEFTNFARDNDLKYWLVHGGLVGWFWNEQLLPWDTDIDVMVLYYDLKHVYAKLHGTVYKNRYLFEVNPNSQYREHQLNDVIDARFIDKLSGLYVDVTAASYDPIRNELHCKSPHYYPVDDIFPLQLGKFCDVPTWLPNNISSMLVKDYGEKCMLHSRFARGKRLFDYKYGQTYYRFDDVVQKWHRDENQE